MILLFTFSFTGTVHSKVVKLTGTNLYLFCQYHPSRSQNSHNPINNHYKPSSHNQTSIGYLRLIEDRPPQERERLSTYQRSRIVGPMLVHGREFCALRKIGRWISTPMGGRTMDGRS